MEKRVSLEEETQKLVEKVKQAGQSVIDNAESIVGNYDYMTDIDISISVPMRDAPTITASATFLPENFIRAETAAGRMFPGDQRG